VKFCKKCFYPENAKPTIIFDDNGVCSGCNYNDSRQDDDVDWIEREQAFQEILGEAKDMAKERGNAHDCIIPISGGKDSHYQVWLLKEKYGMNPLLVSFNHGFNTPSGLRNLRNLTEKSGCDLITYTAGKNSVRKIARYMVEKVGDITWHYHAGIRTLPFKVAVEKNIPLIVWGEHGYAELTGLVSLKDFVEFTKWTRKEHDMRGIEAEELIGKNGITAADIEPYVFPTDDQISETEVRGIYVSNFFKWNAEEHARLMKKVWDFGYITYARERSFNLHSKIEDHANDVHDYMKFIKFGYGRGTDDTSMEIRHGRITREDGIALVKKYDPVEPSSLEFYCNFLGITKKEFYDFLEPMRDLDAWKKDSGGEWELIDPIWKQEEYSSKEEFGRESIIFSDEYKEMYYNPNNKPKVSLEVELNSKSKMFKWL
jgi:N-acetyl sugar amidotransferase